MDSVQKYHRWTRSCQTIHSQVKLCLRFTFKMLVCFWNRALVWTLKTKHQSIGLFVLLFPCCLKLESFQPNSSLLSGKEQPAHSSEHLFLWSTTEKESHMGLEQHKGLYRCHDFHYCVKYPFNHRTLPCGKLWKELRPHKEFLQSYMGFHPVK